MDRTESVMVDYLLKITAKDISITDSRLATEIMHSVSDFEKIGDYCGSLAEEAERHHEQSVAFSADGKREFTYAVEAVRTIIGMTVQAYGGKCSNRRAGGAAGGDGAPDGGDLEEQAYREAAKRHLQHQKQHFLL